MWSALSQPTKVLTLERMCPPLPAGGCLSTSRNRLQQQASSRQLYARAAEAAAVRLKWGTGFRYQVRACAVLCCARGASQPRHITAVPSTDDHMRHSSACMPLYHASVPCPCNPHHTYHNCSSLCVFCLAAPAHCSGVVGRRPHG
jgi:hypothetical protein